MFLSKKWFLGVIPLINIKRRVANLIRKYGTTDPFLIADGLNIDIVPFSLPSSIRGFLVRAMGQRIIFVNNDLDEIHQRIVVCHELGHARLHLGYGYYLHPNSTYYIPSKREHEANEYALHLLSYSHDVDIGLVLKMLKEKRPDPRVVHRILSELTEM